MSFSPRDPSRFSAAWADLIQAVGATGTTVEINTRELNPTSPETEAHRIRSEFYQYRSSLSRKVAAGQANETEQELAALAGSIMVQIETDSEFLTDKEYRPAAKCLVRFSARDANMVSRAIASAVARAMSGGEG